MTTSKLPPAPTAAQMERLGGIVAPLTRVTQPYLEGVETLPRRGALYVGNHTLFAFLDLPFMMSELWQRRRIALRGLGHHAHYAIPVWRDLLEACGMVRGTRENVRGLFAAGEDVLVFPGGGDEVFKGRGMKYELVWKERLGFAKLAIEFGYPIVPFSAVGAEEMYDVVADDSTPVVAQVSALMKRLVGLPLPPIALGLGLLPRPERLYFRFAEPIDTAQYEGDASDESARAVRDATRQQVVDGVEHLMRVRDEDPDRALVRRLRGVAPEIPALATEDPDAYFAVKAFEAWNTHGPAAAEAWMSRWIELDDTRAPAPGGGVRRGRTEVLARLAEVAAHLGGANVAVADARSIGPEQVEVRFDVRAGETNSAPVLGEFTTLVTIDQDQIVRFVINP